MQNPVNAESGQHVNMCRYTLMGYGAAARVPKRCLGHAMGRHLISLAPSVTGSVRVLRLGTRSGGSGGSATAVVVLEAYDVLPPAGDGSGRLDGNRVGERAHPVQQTRRHVYRLARRYRDRAKAVLAHAYVELNLAREDHVDLVLVEVPLQRQRLAAGPRAGSCRHRSPQR